LDVPATKPALLALKRQLAFAEEGYSLLDQKRELLQQALLETSGRAARARKSAQAQLALARAKLRGAVLAGGSVAVDRAAQGTRPEYKMEIKERRLMGLRLPEASATAEVPGAASGPGGPPAGAAAARAFAAALPLLAAQAGLDISAQRLARELKKTQRRCNALSKKVIPDCRKTITYLGGSLEARERESFVILRMIRNRLRVGRGEN
jgi:V/A-type H+-transporting ATPase subunit D